MKIRSVTDTILYPIYNSLSVERVAGFSVDRSYMTFIVFVCIEFNFKEVIRDGHKLSVKCCNKEQLHSQFTFYGRLAFVKASAFVEVNQLIAHQTMNVIYDLSTENLYRSAEQLSQILLHQRYLQ